MGIFTAHTENGKKAMTMDEYISREETIKRIQECYCAGCNSYNGVRCSACGTGDAIDVIEDAPVADVAPVVRCKDCRKFKTYFCRMGASGYNDFCSYGKIKDGNNDT